MCIDDTEDRTRILNTDLNKPKQLPDDWKQTESLSNFKRCLSKDDPIVPVYYIGDNRKPEIVHCRFRLEISDLQGDLVKRHLANSTECCCGYFYGNAHHFIFDCPLYNHVRTENLTGKIIT